MKIAVWSGLGRIGPYVTGVGKHIINITQGLAERNGFDVRLLLAAEHWRAELNAPSHSPLANIPGIELPFKRRQLEALWNESVEQPKLEVINLGFPGTNSSRVVRDFDRLLTVFAPDLLILMVGVNDFWTLPLEVEDPQRAAPEGRASCKGTHWSTSSTS